MVAKIVWFVVGLVLSFAQFVLLVVERFRV